MRTIPPPGTKVERTPHGTWIAYDAAGKPHGQHKTRPEAVRAAEQAVGIAIPGGDLPSKSE